MMRYINACVALNFVSTKKVDTNATVAAM
jgi:hypothetical protein